MTNVNDSNKSRIINQGKVYAECGAARVIEHLNQGEASNAPFSAKPTTPWYAVVLGEETFQTITDPSAAVMMAQLINAGYKAGVSNTTANAVNIMLGNIGKPSSPFAEGIASRLKESHEADHEEYKVDDISKRIVKEIEVQRKQGGNTLANIVRGVTNVLKELEENSGLHKEDEDYSELEKKHMGDPEKKTGIYNPEVQAAMKEAGEGTQLTDNSCTSSATKESNTGTNTDHLKMPWEEDKEESK